MSDDNASTYHSQILRAIEDSPKRWSELKQSTGLSKATLYRYLIQLENENKIARVYQKRGIKWKITKIGKQKAFINSLSKFLKNTNKFSSNVSLIFDHFEPMNKAQIEEQKKLNKEIDEKNRKGADQDFEELETSRLRKALLEGADKELLKQLKTHEALLTIAVAPSIFVLEQPRDSKAITKFMRKVVEFIDSNKEELVSSILPEKSVTLSGENYFKNEAEILIKIDFEASEKLLDKLRKTAIGVSAKQEEEKPSTSARA